MLFKILSRGFPAGLLGGVDLQGKSRRLERLSQLLLKFLFSVLEMLPREQELRAEAGYSQ